MRQNVFLLRELKTNLRSTKMASSTIKDIVQNSTVDHTRTCKEDPGRCLRQIVLDATIFAGMYAILSQLVDKTWPTPDGIAGFISIWIPVAFILKVMQLEYADQLARVIGFQLGTKLFMMMSMP
jgi:hypothetical protein